MRQHIVAYHICKFNVRYTKYPDVFIRRLSGFLATKNEAFRSELKRVRTSPIFYDDQRCRKYPIECFYQRIKFPLNTINVTVDETWIILINALNECSNEDDSVKAILDIMRRRATHVPKWLKFLITSRDTQGIKELSKFEVVYIRNNDIRNKADMKNSFVSDLVTENVKQKLLISVDLTDPSFLYITYSVLYYQDNFKGSRLPHTMAGIYQSSFERLFGFNQNDFNIARTILELVCASTLTRLLSKDLMLNIWNLIATKKTSIHLCMKNN